MAANLEPEKRRLLNQHEEAHFTAGEIVRDIIIGVSDGLTVPFALAAGLSGANATSSIVLTAGIAEVAAGAISMGLGGYFLSLSTLRLHLYNFNCIINLVRRLEKAPAYWLSWLNALIHPSTPDSPFSGW